jgi:transitional endoplasmic reticulum ATPase
VPTKAVATTQQRLQAQALDQLRVIGGQLTKDDDIRFEGKAFIFPERYSGNLKGLLTDVTRYVTSQEEEVLVDKTFDYRPFDGAYATYQCLKQFFGYSQSKARQGPFGPEPPQEITIDLGFINGVLQQETVPWGDMVLPGLPGSTLTLTQNRTDRGQLFRLVARVRKADKTAVDGFFRVVDDYLRENSIYRGKCFDGAMKFFDTDKVRPEQFVYADDVWAQAETNILSPLRDYKAIRAKGLSSKRVTLLEGPFGTGKSGLGRTAAKVAVANGVTAILCRPGQDDPLDLIRTAILYAGDNGALVFIEDIDIIAASRDPEIVTKILDVFDGPTAKNLPITVVMTTNHVEKIHKGMMRSGRIDAVMHIGEMDRAGVEKLAPIVIDTDDLDPNVDYDLVYEATAGFMPAYVKEAYERAVRYTIARTRTTEGKIGTEDLVNALHSLRDQYELQERASDLIEPLPPLDQMFRRMIQENSDIPTERMEEVVDERLNARVHGAQLMKPDGSKIGVIGLNG